MFKFCIQVLKCLLRWYTMPYNFIKSLSLSASSINLSHIYAVLFFFLHLITTCKYELQLLIPYNLIVCISTFVASNYIIQQSILLYNHKKSLLVGRLILNYSTALPRSKILTCLKSIIPDFFISINKTFSHHMIG